MNDKHITALLPDYLDGLLKAEQCKDIAAHLKQCSSCQLELEELKDLMHAFQKEEIAIPSDKLRVGFYKMLEEEKQKDSKVVNINTSKNWVHNTLKVAAGIALLIGSFVLGKFQEQQVSNKMIAVLEDQSIEVKETAMLSLMENQSASRRIQGVNFIEEIDKPDEAILKALADRMLFDVNTNVRLSAVEALGKFTNSETVKNAFIRALQSEKDPSIQITIIHTLVAVQEKKAIAPMRRLLEQEETQPFVKQQIKSLLPSII